MSYFQTLTGLNEIVADYVQTENLSATNIVGGSVNVSSLDPAELVVSDSLRNLKSQPLADGQLLIGKGGSYSPNTISSGSNVTITNAPGSITVATVADPTFRNLTAASILNTSLTINRPLFSDSANNIISHDMLNGQIIIGNNGSYSIANLSAGSNITITNGPGTVSVGVTTTPTFTSVTSGSALITGNATISGTLTCASITNSALSTDTVTTQALTAGTVTATNVINTSLVANCPVFSDANDKLVSRAMQNGQLIIGSNGTYSVGTLTAGSNMQITNGPGTVSLAVDSNPVFSSATVSNLQPGICSVGTGGLLQNLSVSSNGPSLFYKDPVTGSISLEPVTTSASIGYQQGTDNTGKPYASFYINPNLTVSTLNATNIYLPSLAPATNSATSLLGVYSTVGQLVTATVNAGQFLVGSPGGFTSCQLIAGNGINIARSSDYTNMIISATSTSSTTPTTSTSEPTFQITGLASSVPHVLGADIDGNIVNVVQSAGQIPIGNSSGGYTLNTLSVGNNMTIINSSGSITLGMNSSPSFTSLTASSLNASQLVVTDANKLLASLPLQTGQLLTGNSGAVSVATLSANGNLILTSTASAITLDMSTTPTFQTLTLTQGSFTASSYTYTLPAITDTLVSLNATQTLTAKTLTSPVITGGTITNSAINGATITGGTIDGASIGSTTPSDGTFTSVTVDNNLQVGPPQGSTGPVIGSAYINGDLTATNLCKLTNIVTNNPVVINGDSFSVPATLPGTTADTFLCEKAVQHITNKLIDSCTIGQTAPGNGTFAALTSTNLSPNLLVMSDANRQLVTNSTYTSYLANFTSDPQTQINNLSSQATGVRPTLLHISTTDTDHHDTLLLLESNVSNQTDAFYTDMCAYKAGYGGMFSGLNDYSMGYVGCALTADVNVYGKFEVLRAVGNGAGRTGVIIGNDILTVPPPDKGLYVSGNIRCKALASTTSSTVGAASDGTLFLLSSSGTTSTPVYSVGGHNTNPSFPLNYTPSSFVTVLSVSVTFGTGTYRVNSFWNLSVTNTSSASQFFSGYVSDGSVQWARQAMTIPAYETQQLGNTQASFYSTYSNQTVTFSVLFASTGSCTLNADSFGPNLPCPCTELVCNAFLA